MSDEAIHVGVIGAGDNTRSKHIPGLQAIDGVEVVAVCNRSEESSNRVAKEFGIPEVHRNWLDLIDDSATEAIVIGTWPYMHCRASLATLEAGKHVMCEARMAMNAEEAHLMLDASRRNPDLVAQIVPSPMTLRVDKKIKSLIADGYLGEVLAVELRGGGSFLDADGPMHWRYNFDLSGYNTMSMGIWYEALMRWVGPASRIMATGKTYVRSRKDEAGVVHPCRIPEHIDVIGEMACGAQLHLQVSSVAGLAGSPEAFLFGSEGTLRYSGNNLYGGRKGDSELQEIEISPEDEGSWRVEEEFINAIRRKEVITHTDFETGVKYMEFTEAVYLSMVSGQAVSLPF